MSEKIIVSCKLATISKNSVVITNTNLEILCVRLKISSDFFLIVNSDFDIIIGNNIHTVTHIPFVIP
jgi:hypothetical protein